MISNIERKIIILEKKQLDNSSSAGGGSGMPAPISGSVSSYEGASSFGMAGEKVDVFTERLDSLQKDMKLMKKQLKGLNEKVIKDLDHLHKEVASKAEKELLLENQKQFFT